MNKKTPPLNRPAGALPAIDPEKCTACAACVEGCPRGAIITPLNTSCAKCVKYCISMEVPCSPDKVIIEYDLCDACGACVTLCPWHAIYWHGNGLAASRAPRGANLLAGEKETP